MRMVGGPKTEKHIKNEGISQYIIENKGVDFPFLGITSYVIENQRAYWREPNMIKRIHELVNHGIINLGGKPRRKASNLESKISRCGAEIES